MLELIHKNNILDNQYTKFKVRPFTFEPWCACPNCLIMYGARQLHHVRLSIGCTSILQYFTKTIWAHICATRLISIKRPSEVYTDKEKPRLCTSGVENGHQQRLLDQE